MQVSAVVVWWLAWLFLLVAGLPIARALFPPSIERTAFAAIPLSIVAIIVPVHWIGQLTYGPVIVYLATLFLGVIAGLLYRRTTDIDWRGAVEIAGVFTIAFVFLLAIRSVDAGAIPGGGEKFLDFGMLQSLLRAEYLPPADPWWAGGRVVYYYGGHLITATLAHLTGMPGRLAFNLGLASFFGSAVAIVYGLAASIAGDRRLPTGFAGGFAAFLFGFASNLYTTLGALATYLYPPALTTIAAATGHEPNQVRVTIDAFSYWFASRVIEGTITEFPLFVYLNGELHAHVMATSFLMLTATIGYAYYHTPATELRRRRTLIYGVIPIVVGVLLFVNTWSLPAGLGLTWLALTFAPASPTSLLTGGNDDLSQALMPGLLTELRRSVIAFILVLPVALLALFWVSPFVINILLGSAVERGIGFFPPRTNLIAIVVAQGGFFLLFGGYVLGYATRSTASRLLVVGVSLVIIAALAFAVGFPVLALFAPILVGVWYLHRRGQAGSKPSRLRPGYEALLIAAGAGLVLLVEVIYIRDGAGPGRYNTVFKVYAQVWPLWSTAGGVALIALLERPLRETVPEWIPGRRARIAAITGFLVTVSLYGVFALIEHFYAYVGVWWTWAPAIIGGLILLAVLSYTASRSLANSDNIRRARIGEFGSRHPVIVAVLVCLLASHGIIAASAPVADAPGPEPTLDAIAFVHTWHSGEAPAIEWLLDRPGQPYIVSAPGWDMYGWTTEAASLTGLPTVAGWATEGAYRGGNLYSERANDVDLLFRASPAFRAALLDKYDVTYIYVGPNERARYGSADLNFSDEPGITIAYQAPAVTIYAVNESALTTA